MDPARLSEPKRQRSQALLLVGSLTAFVRQERQQRPGQRDHRPDQITRRQVLPQILGAVPRRLRLDDGTVQHRPAELCGEALLLLGQFGRRDVVSARQLEIVSPICVAV